MPTDDQVEDDECEGEPVERDTYKKLNKLVQDPENARDHTLENIGMIAGSIREVGTARSIVIDENNVILAGNATQLGALEAGVKKVRIVDAKADELVAVRRTGLTEEQKKRLALYDNRTAELATWNVDRLQMLAKAGATQGIFSTEQLQELNARRVATQRQPGDLNVYSDGLTPDERYCDGVVGSLAQRFLIPPFTVWDGRQGYWIERKRAWLSLGIRSELGRPEMKLPTFQITTRRTASDADVQNISIFDPVVAELAYRWFCPIAGVVLDPFAGGSVRGIVAAALGRKYIGVDLRQDQCDANDEQWKEVGPRVRQVFGGQVVWEAAPDWNGGQTPIEQVAPETIGGKSIWAKRDDLYAIAGVRGGKARTCFHIASAGEIPAGLITAGSRQSPQVAIVAHIARGLEIPCRVHTPEGEWTPEIRAAANAGAEVIQHSPGHNSVIVARAREDCEARSGWRLIPFGMECREAPEQTATEIPDRFPDGVRRIVVPVGSGMTLSGILRGLQEKGITIPVLGVVVGADPTARLDAYAPPLWRQMCTLVNAQIDYHQWAPAQDRAWGGLNLDPVYEAKCVPFLDDGDLLWMVGVRQTMSVGRRVAVPGASGNTVRWKFSAAWLRRNHDCTAEGIRDRCGGGCCNAVGYWPPRATPGMACAHLTPQGCSLGDDRPVTCHLYPLRLNENGTVVLHNRTTQKTSCCKTAHGNGPMLVDALARNLTLLFGEEEYTRIRDGVVRGEDIEVIVPENVWQCYLGEKKQERENANPPGQAATLAAMAADTVTREAGQASGELPTQAETDFPAPVWLQGDSRNLATVLGNAGIAEQVDMIMTCPPYGDLEIYTDDPLDLSNAPSYEDFMLAFSSIVAQAVMALKNDRFAMVVVGNFRDKKTGFYRKFAKDAIAAFEAAGAMLYNEAIIVSPVGSLPLRVQAQFQQARKLGHSHQTVLVFCKGDPLAATRACGPVEVEGMAIATANE
jgi:1-aminocyclopropane-1-carboxylate deaminase/D-cysteine desulfhydrase-like pyridoxal-dependent ACC family enzyme